MRRIIIFFLFIMLLASSSLVVAVEFTLSSPELEEGQTMKDEQVYIGFGCQGGNISPYTPWMSPSWTSTQKPRQPWLVLQSTST